MLDGNSKLVITAKLILERGNTYTREHRLGFSTLPIQVIRFRSLDPFCAGALFFKSHYFCIIKSGLDWKSKALVRESVEEENCCQFAWKLSTFCELINRYFVIGGWRYRPRRCKHPKHRANQTAMPPPRRPRTSLSRSSRRCLCHCSRLRPSCSHTSFWSSKWYLERNNRA